MKKIYISIVCLLMVAVISSCKKDLEENFNNPEQTAKPSLGNFLTSMLNNDRVRPAYWDTRTFKMVHTAVYAQTASYFNGSSVYQQIDGYVGNRWTDFYFRGNGSAPLSVYNVMESTYNGLSDADKALQQPFLMAAKVVLYDQASQMVDIWGDIPFTEASKLPVDSKIANPKFDDAKTLYTLFIAELDKAATYFSTTPPALAQSAFTKQDILLAGRFNMWQRYANSIRLRLLMRLSFADETFARTEVAKMLASSTTYPLVDGGNVAAYTPASNDILLQPLTTNLDNLNSALTEIGSYYAPDYMLNTVMNPANDPRIPVMFEKYGRTVDGKFVPNANYRAMPVSFTENQQTTMFPDYAIIDSATFLTNSKIPGIVITAPEVNFLKAEAFERWGGGNAETAYLTAVNQAITFSFYLGNTGRGAAISPTGVAAFLTSPTVAYTGSQTEKLAKIWTQKWVSFGLLQSNQAWAEIRRTKYPQLTYPSTGKLVDFETPPNRLRYPNVETGYNSSYSAISAKDTRLAKIFWDVR